jgi:hypothetical protein
LSVADEAVAKLAERDFRGVVRREFGDRNLISKHCGVGEDLAR